MGCRIVPHGKVVGGRRSERTVRQDWGLAKHEAAAVRGALRTAFAQMRSAGGTRITRVVLALGASGHFTEDVAHQHFAVYLVQRFDL